MSIFHCINTIIFIGVLPMCTIKSINVPQHFMKSSMVIKTIINESDAVGWTSERVPLHKKFFWFLITLWIDRSSYISLHKYTSNIETPTLLINSTFVMETVVTQYIRSVFLVQTGDTQWPWAWLCPHQKLLLRENPMNRAPGIEWGGRLRFKFWDLDVFSNQG